MCKTNKNIYYLNFSKISYMNRFRITVFQNLLGRKVIRGQGK